MSVYKTQVMPTSTSINYTVMWRLLQQQQQCMNTKDKHNCAERKIYHDISNIKEEDWQPLSKNDTHFLWTMN